LVFRSSAGVHYDAAFGSALIAAAGRDSAAPFVTKPPPNTNFSPAAIVAATSLVSNFRAARSFQWNATLEQHLRPGSVASLVYAGSSNERLLRSEQFADPHYFL